MTAIGAIQILGFPFVDGLREAGFGVDFLHPSFSSRSPLSLAFLVCSFLVIKGRYKIAALSIALGAISHPTNGAILTLIFLLSLIYLIAFLDEKNFVKTLIITTSVCILGILPILVKVISLSEFYNGFAQEKISSNDYISALYRDEITDFSAIYQMLVHPKLFLLKLAFCILPVGLLILHREKIENSKVLLKLVPLIITPFFIFFAVATIELLYARFGVLQFLMEKVINSQTGCRVIKYAGLPAIFIWFSLFLFYYDVVFKKNSLEVFRSKNRNFNFLLYSNLLLVVFVFLNFSEVKNIQNFSNLISLKNSGESFGKQGRTVYYDTLLNAGYSYEKVNNHFLFDCQTGPISTASRYI